MKLCCGCGWKKSTAPMASAALNSGRNFGSSQLSPFTSVSSSAPLRPSTVTARSSSSMAALTSCTGRVPRPAGRRRPATGTAARDGRGCRWSSWCGVQYHRDSRVEEEDAVRLVLFQAAGTDDVVPGVMTAQGVVGIADAVRPGHTPQLTMQNIIDDFETLRPALQRRAQEGRAMPLSQVRLRPPLPRPGKILACIANYWEHGALEARSVSKSSMMFCIVS